MELELRQKTLRCWEAVCRTAVEQEETAEVIVPDSCPDIWQVLDGSGIMLLQRKEPQEGTAELAGLIRVSILYQPEGEDGIRCMEATLPVHASPTLKDITRRCLLRATPNIVSVDVHLLNPRKILVRVNWQIELEGYAPGALSLPVQVEGGEDWGIRQKTEPFQTRLTVSAQEKLFAYSDSVSLSHPGVTEIMQIRVGCSCSEARVIGNKLVFKGEAQIDLLCREEDGMIFPQTFRLPYSQLMDVEEEEGICDVSFLFSEVRCVLQEDGQTVQVDLTIQAQAVVQQEGEWPVLTDLYSTSHEVTVEDASLHGLRLLEEGREQENGRIAMETGETPAEILDVQLHLGRRSQHTEGDSVVLEQETEAVVLYRGENGPACARKRSRISHRVTAGEICLFSTELLRTPTVSPAGSALEVGFLLGFHWQIAAKEDHMVVSGAAIGEKREREENAPSLIIRAVQPGETLWDIAKEAHTTERGILEAGGLTSEELVPGQMVLIPG